jgi:sugar phosphate isomerase/epimerase
MAADLGSRLGHVHLGDGTGTSRDEHLIPGRGSQPCAELLQRLAAQGYAGAIVIEATTRRAATREEREADLAEALAFCRTHLAGGGQPQVHPGHTLAS